MSEQEWAEVPKMQIADEVRRLRSALSSAREELAAERADRLKEAEEAFRGHQERQVVPIGAWESVLKERNEALAKLSALTKVEDAEVAEALDYESGVDFGHIKTIANAYRRSESARRELEAYIHGADFGDNRIVGYAERLAQTEAEAAKLRERVAKLESMHDDECYGGNDKHRLSEENAKLRAVADAAAAIGDIRQGPVLKAALAALGDKPEASR